jgi:hypothetical protein
MVAAYVLSTRTPAGADFNARPRQKGLWQNVDEPQGRELGDPIAGIVDLPRVMDDVNRGRQAA